MENLLICYLVFQVIIWFISSIFNIGENIRTIKEPYDGSIIMFVILSLPLINIFFILCFIYDEKMKQDFNRGLKFLNNVYGQYIVKTIYFLPVLLLVSLFYI